MFPAAVEAEVILLDRPPQAASSEPSSADAHERDGVLDDRLDAARIALAAFVGAAPEDLDQEMKRMTGVMGDTLIHQVPRDLPRVAGRASANQVARARLRRSIWLPRAFKPDASAYRLDPD